MRLTQMKFDSSLICKNSFKWIEWMAQKKGGAFSKWTFSPLEANGRTKKKESVVCFLIRNWYLGPEIFISRQQQRKKAD